jgi:hypothetical protein
MPKTAPIIGNRRRPRRLIVGIATVLLVLGLTASPASAEVWIGHNQFGCKLQFPDGDRVYARSSSGGRRLGFKPRLYCPTGLAYMHIQAWVMYDRGMYPDRSMGGTGQVCSGGQYCKVPLSFSTPCEPGTHSYYGMVFAEMRSSDGRYSAGKWDGPGMRTTC